MLILSMLHFLKALIFLPGESRSRVLLSLFFICLIHCMSFSQICDSVKAIVTSSDNDLIKQNRIDNLKINYEGQLSGAELADFYHCIGLHWHYLSQYQSCDYEAPNSKKCTIFLDRAISTTQQALILKRKQDSLNIYSIKNSLYNLGVFNYERGTLYDAIDYYKDLTSLGGTDAKTLNARRDLGMIYILLGDFHNALESFNQFSGHYEKKKTLDFEGEMELVDIYIRQAELYAGMGFKKYSSKIKSYLTKADSLLRLTASKNGSFEEDLNRIYQLEGNRLVENGMYREALDYHSKVTSNLSNLSLANLAIAYNSLAYTQLKLKDYKSAYKNLLKSISFDVSYTDPYNNLGDLYAFQNEFNKGMYYYQKSIIHSIDREQAIDIDTNPPLADLELLPNKTSLLNHIITKANGWIKYYEYDGNKEHLTHALETFALADQLVDLIRFESVEYQSKLYWREQGAALYMKAVEVCHLLNKPEEAFHFMERNKALLLLEDLTNEEAKEIAQIPNKAAEREFNLKRDIFLSENSLQEASNESNKAIVALKDSIRESKYRYELFVDSLNESYPDYAKFKKKAAVLSFPDLKTNYVSNNKAVLHYILNEEQGYGLLTLPDTTLLFQMKDIPILNKNVETLIAALSDGISDIDRFQKVSNSVFGQLLPDGIYDKIKGKQLLIIPDYTLQQIPFEAFVVNNGSPPIYLIEDVEIGYAYSMSLLDHTRGQEKNAPNDLVAFAPVQFDGMGLPQLYFSENEITGITEVYPGKTFLNGKASKASFIENVGQHKIVHLATHADIGDEDNPWIAFSDSKMYLKEIYATRNQADMVVLSACNTSNGELKRGEGVMSLARGFFYSGAKSVVSTLWPVADEAGKDILIDFYKNLNQGDSKSEALRKAKLDYLKTTEEVELKHPYYWAGFIVVGDNAPMVVISYGYWVLLGTGILVLLFLLFRGKLFKGIQ